MTVGFRCRNSSRPIFSRFITRNAVGQVVLLLTVIVLLYLAIQSIQLKQQWQKQLMQCCMFSLIELTKKINWCLIELFFLLICLLKEYPKMGYTARGTG